jgi:hypothetical protein
MAGEQPFRFLKGDEFFALAVHDRAVYLVRASHELESRQKVLREQMRYVIEVVGGSDKQG